jgi:lipoate-protein ligase A
MHLFDLTLPSPQENLALDEALLDVAESAGGPLESLRLWESPEPIVVLGRGSRAASEVRLAYCRRHGIPVLRRTSGGTAVVAAPGSLMYALVLSYETRPELRAVDQAHRFVLETILSGIRPLVPAAERRGTSDLAVGGHKFSGNSVRCKRTHFLYHGTLLYACDLSLVERCLAMPPRQPEYRKNRPHEQFVANIPVNCDALRDVLVATWQAQPAEIDWPRRQVRQLVATRYSQPEWNLRH